MSRALLERLRQTRPFPDPIEEAGVQVLVAAAWLDGRIGELLEPFGLTHAQFNVLRILKGVHPDGHPRCEIAARLIVRSPDVTRLIDRLVVRGLVTRGRGEGSDRRQSVARITRKGIAVVERASGALSEVHDQLAGRLGERGCAELSRLCEALWVGV
jgi:DNA-binding MarR family transcriptional regulator